MDDSFADGGSSPPVTENLWHWLSKTGFRSPHRPAVLSAEMETSHLQSLAKSRTSVEEGFSWNYEDLFSAVDQLASFLTDKRIQPGDCLVCYVSNSVDYVLLFWTSARLGTTFVPILPTTLDDEALSQHYLDLLKPKVVIVQDTGAALKLDGYLKDRGDCLKVTVAPLKDKSLSTWSHITDAAKSSSSLPDTTSLPVDATAMVLFTSGSTGLPKACPITNTFIQTELFQYLSMVGHVWTSDSRALCLSGSHLAICYLGLCITACQGASLLMLPRPWPEPEKILEEIEKQKCTHLWATSSLLYKLARAAANAPSLRPTTLETIMTSGEVTHESKIELANRHLRPKRFLSLWGMTEGAPHLGWSQEYIDTCKPMPIATPGRIAGSGTALPGTMAKVAIADGASETPVPRGEYGMLHLSSPALIEKYLGGKGADDFYTDATGRRWFKTGDLAMMDADGYFYLLGREKEAIRTRKGMAVACILDDALQKIFECEAFSVGVADEHEKFSVPVAVLKMDQKRINELCGQGSTTLQSSVGEHYVPCRYIAQDRLGLGDQWPTNSAGKFARGDLQTTVRQFMKQEVESLVY